MGVRFCTRQQRTVVTVSAMSVAVLTTLFLTGENKKFYMEEKVGTAGGEGEGGKKAKCRSRE